MSPPARSKDVVQSYNLWRNACVQRTTRSQRIKWLAVFTIMHCESIARYFESPLNS